MDDLAALVGSARDVAESITHEAGDQLLAGADIERVHERFVVVAMRLLEEVELRAVLAGAGDPDAAVQGGTAGGRSQEAGCEVEGGGGLARV